MAERKKYKSPMSGMWRGSMPRPVRQGPLPLDQAYGVLADLPDSARGLPEAVGISGIARPAGGLTNRLFPRSPQMYALDEMYADVSQIPGMAKSLSGSARGVSGAGGLSGAGRGVGQSIYNTVQAIPGSARNLSEAVGISGSMRGQAAGVSPSPMSGAWRSTTVQRPQQGPLPLDSFVDMLGRIRSTLGTLGGASGGQYQYEPVEPPPSMSYARRGSQPTVPVQQQVGAPQPTAPPVPQRPAAPAVSQPATSPPQTAIRPAAGQGPPGIVAQAPSVAAAPIAVPPPTPQRPPIPDSLVGVFSGPQNLAQSRLPRFQDIPGQRPPTPSMQPPAAPQAAPMTAGAVQPMAVSRFSQLPAAFQERYRARVAAGLNQGISESDAVDFYNRNYQGSMATPGGSRQSPLAPPASFRYVPSPPGYVQPVVEPAAQPTPAMTASELASQLEADRLARRGLFGGPSPEAVEERKAEIQRRLDNPEPGSLGDFMRGEMGARSEEGREKRRQQMDQSFLSKPMQGGGFSMADREARLSMLSPPGQRQAAAQEQMASRARTGTAADEAIRAELMRQEVTQEQLNEAAELRGDPDIALGGRRAISMLAPGTSIRTPEGGLIMRGRDRQTTPEDLERRAAGRIADRLAPQERMNRMRAGRQAMMANRAAAEREMFERATNPLVNPMLLAGNPVAMAEAMRIRQQQQEFLAGEPERQARIGRTRAETEAFERANSQEMLDLERQQRELAIKKAEQELAAGERLLDPTVAARQESEDAFRGYLELTPEERRGPLGRELINRWRAGTGGASPLVPPQTAADARDEATALSQPITALIGEDPNSYRTADSLLKKIRSLQESGVTISEQDQTAVQQYIQNRSMYDATFGSNLPTPLQGLGDWIMSAASLPFSASVQQSPQAIPPQFMYPRMGG